MAEIQRQEGRLTRKPTVDLGLQRRVLCEGWGGGDWQRCHGHIGEILRGVGFGNNGGIL